MSFVNREYVYQAVNEAYLSTFGKTQDQIIGRTAAYLFGDAFFKTTLKPRRDRCLRGEPARFQVWLAVSGGVPRYWDVRYSPIQETDGSISGVGIVVRDITDQKRAEDALRKSDRLYSALFKQSAVGVAELNSLTGAFTRINPYYCDRLGYTSEEMLRMDFQSITHPASGGYR